MDCRDFVWYRRHVNIFVYTASLGAKGVGGYYFNGRGYYFNAASALSDLPYLSLNTGSIQRFCFCSVPRVLGARGAGYLLFCSFGVMANVAFSPWIGWRVVFVTADFDAAST